MRIAFLLLRRLVRIEDMRAGRAPTEFAYGALEMAARGAVECIEIDPYGEHGWLDALPGAKLVLGKTEPRHFRVARQLCERLNAFDCVVSMCAKTASALGWFARRGKLRPPIVAIRCGVINERLNPLALRVQRALVHASHSILFGEGEYRPFLDEFKLGADQVTVNQFGVDARFWRPGGERGDFLLSVGNDSQRDFSALLDAAFAIPAPIRIITTRKLREPLPPNVTVQRGALSSREFTDAELRDLYQRARCVVTPLRETYQPSGQSSTLQAMACGTPVVLTRTRGLWSSAMMRDGDNVLLTAPGDSTALSANVRRLLDDPVAAERIGTAARATVENEASIVAFAERLEATCRRVTAARAQ
ncbi:MAG: glycosyltransferase family 4 protein [Chthoniobacter sp.]|nr:glycosyltransferase family 4 protein [Chthoniobacter sp.]